MVERGADRPVSRVRDARGAAAVEFALVVIPLLYLVFGVIEYGYMLSVRQSISQAAAEGARAAAIGPAGSLPQERARDAVTDALTQYDLVCATNGDLTHDAAPVGDCEVSTPGDCDSGTTDAQCVTVTIAYEYEALSGVGYGFVLPDRLTYTTDVQVS